MSPTYALLKAWLPRLEKMAMDLYPAELDKVEIDIRRSLENVRKKKISEERKNRIL